MKSLLRMFLLVLALATAGAGTVARADEQEQTVVIGLGILGLHSFARGDDIRDAAFNLDIGVAGMNQAYVEWYVIERLGIGLRSILLGVEEKATITTSSGTTSETTKLTVWNHFLTLNVLPVIADSGYWRIGFLAGAGVSDYKVEQSGTGGSSSVQTDGPAALAQVYVDWGGDSFGARFGIGTLKTQLKDVELKEAPDVPLKADASGSHAYLDLRWAF